MKLTNLIRKYDIYYKDKLIRNKNIELIKIYGNIVVVGYFEGNIHYQIQDNIKEFKVK